MRGTLLSLGLALALAATAPGADVHAAPYKLVYLDGAADLAQLRATNPSHYARAQRVLGAAGELCRPGPGDVSFARLDARDVSCARMLLKTSNPPKRQISFTLDDTRYIALVVVTDDPPRLVPTR
jgi:hypothetical protein